MDGNDQLMSSTDIGASESMMKKKTKQDFQELLKTEHCKGRICLFHTIHFGSYFLMVFERMLIHFLSSWYVIALLEGFEVRECIAFIEEHINRQVSCYKCLLSAFIHIAVHCFDDPINLTQADACVIESLNAIFSSTISPPVAVGVNDWKSEASLSVVYNRKWWVLSVYRKKYVEWEVRSITFLVFCFTGLLPKDYRSLKAQFLQVSIVTRWFKKVVQDCFTFWAVFQCLSLSLSYSPHLLSQSYGIEHLLTFANLRQLGILVEQQPGETLTVMESKVGKLVNDRTAGNIYFYIVYDYFELFRS